MISHDSAGHGSGTCLAFFIPHFGDGGIERNAINLSREYLSRGHKIDIVTFQAEETMRSEIPAGAGFVDLGTRRTLTSILSLRSYLRRTGCDILISAQTHANVAAVIATKLAFTGTRLVLTERLALEAAWGLSRGRRDRFLPMLMRLAYPRAAAIVANSSGTADHLARTARLRRDKIHVIYNPAVWGGLKSASNEPVDHEWFTSGEVPIVCAVGRLVPQKDLGSLLKAFSLLRSRVAARLVLVGDGPLRRQLEAEANRYGISDDVWFAGYQSNPYKFMAGSAVLALTSKYEGFGNVLAEAQALGVPVVSTDCEAGPGEILLDGAAGRLVPVGGVDEIADAIEASLVDSGNTRSMVSKASKNISRFEVKKIADDFLEVVAPSAGD